MFNKNLTFIDSAASSGGQKKLRYVYFPCPSLEAGMPVSTFFASLFTKERKVFFLIYMLNVTRSYPRVTAHHPTLGSTKF